MNRIGIRREDKNRWERRVPLTPAAVGTLVADRDIPVHVQTSDNRIFSDDSYRSEGATVVDDLADADVILAVKEIPPELLAAERTYVFFSHTIKGQPHSMPLLQRVLDVGATLIDYEAIVGTDDRRLVHFGRFAGLAGVVDALGYFGRRLRALGVELPFASLRPSFEYDSLEGALEAVAAVGAVIAKQGMPAEVGPLVIGVTGYGHVAQGALEVLDRLPKVDVAPADVTAEFIAAASPQQVYVTVFTERDTVARMDGRPVTLKEYRNRPADFVSTFAPAASQLSMLVNSVLWQPSAPRLLTIDELRAMELQGARLSFIADLSCDIRGGIEATVRATTSDEPVFIFDPQAGTATTGFEGPGIAILAVDNLPCEFPLEASEAFSEALAGMVPDLALADFSRPFDELDLPAPLKNAVVVHQGQLTPRFAHLAEDLHAANRDD